MRITCPACKLSRDIPESRIPANAKFVTCPRCGTKFDFNRDDYDEPAPAAASSTARPASESASQIAAGTAEPSGRTRQERERAGEGVPWESDASRSMLVAFFKTIKGALFTPGKMFSSMAPYGKSAYPLSFAITIGTIIVLFGVLNHFFSVSEYFFAQFPNLGAYRDPALIVGGPVALILIAIFAPLWITLTMYIGASILHVSLLILKGATFRFQTTLKVVCYTSAAQVWYIAPFIGQAIGGVWGLAILIIGLSKAHRISKLKVFMAIILPAILVVMIIFVVTFTLAIIMP